MRAEHLRTGLERPCVSNTRTNPHPVPPRHQAQILQHGTHCRRNRNPPSAHITEIMPRQRRTRWDATNKNPYQTLRCSIPERKHTHAHRHPNVPHCLRRRGPGGPDTRSREGSCVGARRCSRLHFNSVGHRGAPCGVSTSSPAEGVRIFPEEKVVPLAEGDAQSPQRALDPHP